MVTGGQYLAGKLPRKGGNKIELFGTAVFDGDNMVGELSGDETRYLLIGRGEFERGFFTLRDPLQSELVVPLDVRPARKPEVKIRFRDGTPVIRLKVRLEGDILAVQSRINYEDVQLMYVLEKTFSLTVLFSR